MRLTLLTILLLTSACGQKMRWEAPDHRAIMRQGSGVYYRDTWAAHKLAAIEKSQSPREREMWKHATTDPVVEVYVVPFPADGGQK